MYRKIFKFLSLSLYLGWLLFALLKPTLPKENEPFTLFATCDDSIKKGLLATINEAKTSLYVSIYTLKEQDVIDALTKKMNEGVEITLLYDPETEASLKPLTTIKRIEKSGSGLMHQKIIVADQKKVFLGSANFTPESLYLDENIGAAIFNETVAQAILNQRYGKVQLDTQLIEYFPLPQLKAEAFEAVVAHLKSAKKSLRVALFTYTHKTLIDEVIEAHKRGVKVEVILDGKSARGTSKIAAQRLKEEGVSLRTSNGPFILHHKFALIDDEIFIMGSANWTKAAFSKNEESVLMITPLTKVQKRKIKALWHSLVATTHL